MGQTYATECKKIASKDAVNTANTVQPVINATTIDAIHKDTMKTEMTSSLQQ